MTKARDEGKRDGGKPADEIKPAEPAAGFGPAFDPIDAALRQIHDRVTSEPVPDDFMDLLDQLDRSMRDGKTS